MSMIGNELDRLNERIELLESLLVKAYQVINRAYDTRNNDPLLDEIRRAMPHPDPRRHGCQGYGETICGIELIHALPRARLATKEEPLDCVDCMKAYIKQRREQIFELQKNIDDTVELITKAMHDGPA